MIKEGLAEKVMFEQRSEGSKGRSHEAVWAEYRAGRKWAGEIIVSRPVKEGSSEDTKEFKVRPEERASSRKKVVKSLPEREQTGNGRSSQPMVIFPIRRHLIMSGDIFPCHSWRSVTGI